MGTKAKEATELSQNVNPGMSSSCNSQSPPGLLLGTVCVCGQCVLRPKHCYTWQL